MCLCFVRSNRFATMKTEHMTQEQRELTCRSIPLLARTGTYCIRRHADSWNSFRRHADIWNSFPRSTCDFPQIAERGILAHHDVIHQLRHIEKMNTCSSKIAINMLKMTHARMLLRKHLISPSSRMARSPLNNFHEGDLSSDESSDPEQHEPLQHEINAPVAPLPARAQAVEHMPSAGQVLAALRDKESRHEANDAVSHMETAYPHKASCPNKMRASRSATSNHSLMLRSQAQPDFAELGLNGIFRVSGVTAEPDAFDMSALNADVRDEIMKSDEQDRACKEISTDLSTADFLRLLPTDSKGLPTWPRSEGPHARRGRAIAQQTHKRIMPDSDSDSDFEDRETSAKSKSKQSKTHERLNVRAL